jgi:hypothetical protein
VSHTDVLLRRLRRRVLLREIIVRRGAAGRELVRCDAEIDRLRQQLAAVVSSGAARR